MAVIASNEAIHDEWLLIVGFVIWAIGFCIEVLSDWQLDEFIKHKKKGEVMDKGLWKYSRHPNYFGEVTLWWGIWVISLSINPVWWSVIGPLTITFLILFVSGVPMLEKSMKKNKNFREYSKRTSIFIPLPPKAQKK